MTKSNHSNTLPIVAATISRFIEGGFGSTESGIVSAVISFLPGVIVVTFIREPAASGYFPEARGGIPDFRVLRAAWPIRGAEAKTNHTESAELLSATAI